MQLHLKTNPYYHIGKESSLKISWLRLVSPQQFDLCDDEYLCHLRVLTTLIILVRRTFFF